MKRTRSVLAAYASGGVAITVNDLVVFPIWWNTLDRSTVVNWITSITNDQLGGFSSLIYLKIPEWTVAFSLGVLLGLNVRTRVISFAIRSSLAFILVPDLLTVLITNSHPWLYFAMKISVITLCWQFMSIPVLFAGVWIARRIRPFQQPGHCANCGYDLRGAPSGGSTNCPECGHTTQVGPDSA